MKRLLLLLLLLTGCGLQPGQETSYPCVAWKTLTGFPCPNTKSSSVPIPAEVKSLDGQRLQLSGYMVPLEMEGTRTQSFLLVRDQMLCCFGKMPALNEWVFVEFPKGAGQELQPDKPLVVSGRFRAREEKEKGVVLSLYRMEAEKVEVLQGTPKDWKAS